MMGERDQARPYEGFRPPNQQEEGQTNISKRRFEDFSEIPKYSELDLSVERSLLFTDKSLRDTTHDNDTTRRMLQKKQIMHKQIE